MTINRGTGIIKRRHPINYIGDESNKRFEHEVRPYQERGLQALNVDYFEVNLYSRAMSTMVCTCKQTEVIQEQRPQNLTPNQVNPYSDSDAEIAIDYYRPLFGNKTEAVNNTDYTKSDEFDFDDDDIIDEALDEDEVQSTPVRNLLGSNADCGICYKTGFVPGFNLYGWDRKLLCTYHVSNIYGYHQNHFTTPHSFQKEDDKEGFVEFDLVVPRYFDSVKVCIRNNHQLLLEDNIYVKDSFTELLSLSHLKQVAGRQITVRVLSEVFTHVVFEFNLGLEPVHCNIAMMNRNLDWTMFDTLGNLNLILPMTIPEVQSTEYVWVPKRNHLLKITDTPFLRVADGRNLDWSVNSRIVQPQEPILKIVKSRPLY